MKLYLLCRFSSKLMALYLMLGLGTLAQDKKFYYHQQSVEYTNRKLQELSDVEHGQESLKKTIGPIKVKVSSNLDEKFGSAIIDDFSQLTRLEAVASHHPAPFDGFLADLIVLHIYVSF